MGSIDRYIFRTTLASFALVLVSLTGVIWITQALRGIDLMTSQGQTILTFLGVTSLVIPALVLIISPIALMIAISHTLNKLATDSETIVMNAAGFSPFRLFRPFIYATCVVAILSCGFEMLKFCKQGHDGALGIRERYLWELLSPPDDDPVYTQLPGQFRAELHDRFMSPIYPFAFAALTFAFLGAPRTTRQSRNFSIGSSILAVFGLRMVGFACSVMAVNSPLAVVVQYLMLAAALGVSLWIIIGGVVIEPPAGLCEMIEQWLA